MKGDLLPVDYESSEEEEVEEVVVNEASKPRYSQSLIVYVCQVSAFMLTSIRFVCPSPPAPKRAAALGECLGC